jgi:hypothetical protein
VVAATFDPLCGAEYLDSKYRAMETSLMRFVLAASVLLLCSATADAEERLAFKLPKCARAMTLVTPDIFSGMANDSDIAKRLQRNGQGVANYVLAIKAPSGETIGVYEDNTMVPKQGHWVTANLEVIASMAQPGADALERAENVTRKDEAGWPLNQVLLVESWLEPNAFRMTLITKTSTFGEPELEYLGQLNAVQSGCMATIILIAPISTSNGYAEFRRLLASVKIE